MDIDDHIPPEQIAALAEGQLSPEASEEILKHLSRCRSCMAAYVEAVRYRAAWLSAPEAFEPPEELVALGLRAIAGEMPAPAPARPSQPRWVGYASAAAGVAMLALVGRAVLFPPVPEIALPPAVSTQLALLSAKPGGLFLPGATERAPRVDETKRGGSVDVTEPELNRAADSLGNLHRQARSARERARTAYAYAAALRAGSRLEQAHEVALEALKPGGNQCAARVLLAEMMFRDDKDTNATAALTQAMHQGCNDCVTRMDWALLKASSGDTAEANPIFREYSARRDALGERARSELHSHE